jgi:hypothetical protein
MAASNLRRFVILGVVLGLALGSGCERGRNGSSVTKANADKIQVGMTEQEVVAILGTPTDSAEIALPGMAMPVGVSLPGGVEMPKIELPKNAKQSNWRDGGKVISVTFGDGKVLASVLSDSTPLTDKQAGKTDTASKTAPEAKSAAIDDTPFTQTGYFTVIADQQGVVNFAIPYALAPNVEISGPDGNCVLITENKATGFKWKGVTKPAFSGSATWTAKGIKATKIPEGDAK